MHPALKRGTKNFHYTSKTCGILVISIFYETKIRTVDMKVHEYSKFRKNKISKKVKSINSMENGRFDTSKYRGKLEKMGVLCTHSPKSPGPFPKLPIKKLKKKKIPKKRDQVDLVQVSTRGRHRVDAWTGLACPLFMESFILLPSTYCASGQLLLVGFSTWPPCLEFT
jgi:hypothetical protein